MELEHRISKTQKKIVSKSGLYPAIAIFGLTFSGFFPVAVHAQSNAKLEVTMSQSVAEVGHAQRGVVRKSKSLTSTRQVLISSTTPKTIPSRILQPGEYAPDEILVMPRSGLENDDLNASLSAANGQIKETISNGSLTTYVVHVDQQEMSRSFYKLKQDKNFDVVQCNLFCKMQSAPFPQGPPNDPEYSQQYALPLMHIPQAWALAGNGYGVTLGIIDSGVDGQETELYGRIEAGYNAITGKPANTDSSPTGHGTAVASLMAASTNNDSLGASPAFGVAIYPTDVFNGKKTAKESDVIKAYTWLENTGIRLINLSINDPLPNTFNNQNAHPALWKYFIDFWNNHNGLTVNSAGNDGGLDTSPLSKYLIVVSAIDANSDPASFSDYGPGISFAAPGVSVGTGDFKNKFTSYTGTSYACPFVTGIIAEAIANNQNKTNDEIYAALKKSVINPPNISEPHPLSYYYGYGIPNAQLLLQNLMP